MKGWKLWPHVTILVLAVAAIGGVKVVNLQRARLKKIVLPTGSANRR